MVDSELSTYGCLLCADILQTVSAVPEPGGFIGADLAGAASLPGTPSHVERGAKQTTDPNG